LNEQESLREENLEWANQAESLRLESGNLTRQVGDLEQQKIALEGQLGELRSTIGVRLLARYWAAARRLAPPGSRQRRWYGRIRAALIGAEAAAVVVWGTFSRGFDRRSYDRAPKPSCSAGVLRDGCS
jgi:hypothetical protein